jgi:glycogen debranching enzyme
MVNGFYGLALLAKEKNDEARMILNALNQANAIDNYSFYENFNSRTKAPNGVAFCAWSGAATVMLHQSVHSNFKFLV